MADKVTKSIPLDDLESLQEILERSKQPRVKFTGVFEDMRVSAESSRMIAINDAINILDRMINK